MDVKSRRNPGGSDEECLLKNDDHGARSSQQAENDQSPPPYSKYRWLRIVPLLCFYIIAGSPLETVRSQYLYTKVQEYMNVTLTETTGNCTVNVSDPNYILQQQVQAESARWNMNIRLAHFMPSLIMTVFFGIYSDHLGRRITFILPPIGSMMSCLLTMAMLTFDLPIQFFFGEVIEYMFGGMFTMFMGAFAYIADTVPPEKRSVPMTILDSLFLICAAVTELFVGKWIHTSGYLPPLYFVMVGKIITLIYAIFFIPETIGHEKVQVTTSTKASSSPSQSTKAKFSFKQVKHGFFLYLKDNGTGRRWKLNILLASYVIASIITARQIMTLFEMNSPLCWDSVFIGYFGSASMALRCIATLIGTLLLRRVLSEAWICVIARVQSIAENIYLAFVKSTVMMFFVPVVGCLSIMAIPMTRAIMSRLVERREQGSMFAVMTCAENFASLISTLSVNNIYASTLFFMEGFIFLCGAIFSLMSLGCVLFFIWYSNKEKKDVIMKNGSVSIQP